MSNQKNSPKTMIMTLITTSLLSAAVLANNTSEQTAINVIEQTGSNNISIIDSKQTQLQMIDSAYVSDRGYGSYPQSNNLRQHAHSEISQSGSNNVAIIHSRQTQRQVNSTTSQGRGYQAQNNRASQHAINVSKQIGHFNLSVINNRQNSIQGNRAITMPRFTGLNRASVSSSSYSSSK